MIKVAVYQNCAAPTDLGLNCWKIVSEMEKAISEGARLICFPEWFLSGLDWNRNNFLPCALSDSHKIWPKIQDLCQTHQVAVTLGGLEKYLNGYYSSIFSVNEKGERDVYRKQNPYWLEKFLPMSYGHQPIVINTLGLKIGLLTGYDLFSNEILELYQNLACDLFIASSALVDSSSIKIRSGVFTLLGQVPQVLAQKFLQPQKNYVQQILLKSQPKFSSEDFTPFLTDRTRLLKAPLIFCNQSGWMELPVPWVPLHLTFSWSGQSQIVYNSVSGEPVKTRDTRGNSKTGQESRKAVSATQQYRGWLTINLDL